MSPCPSPWRGARRGGGASGRALLTQVGIEPQRQGHRPSRLSGGQQQRVAIARALANDPPVLLADEPTGNLNARSRGQIVALFRQLARDGRTVILVTHDPAVARRADSHLSMRDGRIVGIA